MLTVSSTDDRCNAVGNEQFSLTGAKLIGTSPNVLAFVTSSETSASGSVSLSNIEWDTYTIALSDASQDVAGTVPFSPLTIDPSSTQTFQFILQPAANPSLLVSVADASTLAGISNANVAIADGGVNESLVTDHATFSQNNWSGGQYASQDGGIDDSNAGTLTLLANASGTYSTSTTDWLISNTFDVGGTASTFNTLSWTPATEPPNITLEFQVAANNDDATWNFVGPDGTASTYFTSTTSTLPASLAGNRYFRYEVFMSTQDPNATPVLHGVSVDFTANCVPPAQTLFTSITPGTYSVDVTAPNYVEATGTAVVGTGESSTTILMTQS
ncbi:MAG TPA: hypothetical protein VHZ04_02645, partial [Candidatus Paceibacterota bacterium]|nr:hypothetical protein [Candidatus Paceibacterota bacterium]